MHRILGLVVRKWNFFPPVEASRGLGRPQSLGHAQNSLFSIAPTLRPAAARHLASKRGLDQRTPHAARHVAPVRAGFGVVAIRGERCRRLRQEVAGKVVADRVVFDEPALVVPVDPGVDRAHHPTLGRRRKRRVEPVESERHPNHVVANAVARIRGGALTARANWGAHGVEQAAARGPIARLRRSIARGAITQPECANCRHVFFALIALAHVRKVGVRWSIRRVHRAIGVAVALLLQLGPRGFAGGCTRFEPRQQAVG